MASIYGANYNREYLQKYLKCQAERLRFERSDGLIKVKRSVSTLIENGVEKMP